MASCQSRFNNPEIIAVMGDVKRRLKLLKGTTSAVVRKGSAMEFNVLPGASSQDIKEAMETNIMQL